MREISSREDGDATSLCDGENEFYILVLSLVTLNVTIESNSGVLYEFDFCKRKMLAVWVSKLFVC
jgi:hypothetical protein